ncbi:hypothetical protein GALL_494420 [mine drainage metagenome]|uniref:Uncharacterized protein n=1 Tax=mine drainage metagenome TaxID=410659 RepID=A0A1J5PMG7_9ZZZZ
MKSPPPITPSERGRDSLSEINQSSKLLPGSAEASTLRIVKFLVAPSTVRMNAGEPPSFCRTATYCADAAAGERGALASTTWVRGRRMLSGSNPGRRNTIPIIATRAAAIAEVRVATVRQRLTFAVNRMTLELSTTAATAAHSSTGVVMGEEGACGNTIGACGSECPTVALILSQTSGRGSTDPTIWLRTPSLCSHAWTIAVKSLSTDIMVSACARSSASRVPSAYSAASAIWSSL